MVKQTFRNQQLNTKKDKNRSWIISDQTDFIGSQNEKNVFYWQKVNEVFIYILIIGKEQNKVKKRAGHPALERKK